MKGLPLACFDKPAFEEDGLEFFVCQGGAGLGGVRKKAAGTIYVGELDIALNLNAEDDPTELQRTIRCPRVPSSDGVPLQWRSDSAARPISARFQS
jgi:hypothetical protein